MKMFYIEATAEELDASETVSKSFMRTLQRALSSSSICDYDCEDEEQGEEE